MNTAKLATSVLNAAAILKKFELYKSLNYRKKSRYDSGKFSEEFIRASQEQQYSKMYQIAIKNADYDIILQDDSIFQFSCEEYHEKITGYRFAFLQNPREYPSYDDFLQDVLGQTEEECGEIFMEEYEQMICEAQINNGAIPVRYDYDEKYYDSRYHPVSHIHIGNNNSIRIACDKILMPDSFVLFVIKQIYFKRWKNACKNDSENYEISLQSKRNCLNIENEFLNSDELKHFHMT